jgi:hypothetical protein
MHRMAAYGLGETLVGRYAPVYRLFTSGANTSLAFIDEFDRTLDLGHRRAVLVVRFFKHKSCTQTTIKFVC